jgi:hypothetical protein
MITIIAPLALTAESYFSLKTTPHPLHSLFLHILRPQVASYLIDGVSIPMYLSDRIAVDICRILS